MLAFYRAPQTSDSMLMDRIIAEEEEFVKNNKTGYESMYVRTISPRGTTALDPVSAKDKVLSQQQNARFGLTIAGR